MLVSIEGLRTISGLTLHTLHGFAASCLQGLIQGGWIVWLATPPLGVQCSLFEHSLIYLNKPFL